MRSYIYNKNSVIGSQAEHCGMRTYFFSADTQEDLNGWIRAMNQAARMQQSHTVKRSVVPALHTKVVLGKVFVRDALSGVWFKLEHGSMRCVSRFEPYRSESESVSFSLG
jgi:hypothetical protein